jgi:predicted metal-dependent phosphoesterase TrpH
MDPFTSAGTWLRCALHAHTTASDGEAPPSALAAHYARAGYDVLATTDHWQVTPIESDEILVIAGAELNAALPYERDGHVLAFGIEGLPERREPFPSLAEAAEWIDGAGGVAYLAHPRWTGAGLDEVIDAPAVRGIEVLNAGCELECSRGLADDYWDALLARGRVCFGLATDDSHMPGFDSGHAWTWVKAEERSAAAVMDALRNGRFYASHGPEITGFEFNGSLTLTVSPSTSVALVAGPHDGGRVNAGRLGLRHRGEILEQDSDGAITRVRLERPRKPGWARLEVTDARGRRAWTNPIHL